MTSDAQPPAGPADPSTEGNPARSAFDFDPTLLLESLHVVYLLADRNLIVRALYGNTALAGGAVVGMHLLDADPELRARTEQLAAILDGSVRRLDVGLVKRTEAEGGRYVLAQSVALYNREGAIIGISHVLAEAAQMGARWERMERHAREMAALHQRVARLSVELDLAQSELKRLDEVKLQFVSAAAHELRNPLASLIGFLELLEAEDDGSFSAAQRDYVRGIQRSAQRLRLLTNNLLDLSRIDSNRLELVLTIMDALELVEQAVGEIQPLMEAKQQRLILKAEPGLPRIWCDRQRAMQILTNLLSNAHKYTPAGGAISVQVSRLKGSNMLCLRVKDTGIGISAEDQKRIFTRFYRAGNAGVADGSGAGLGLAITQSLVRLHGGKLWFESKLGKGTSFYVTFPIAE